MSGSMSESRRKRLVALVALMLVLGLGVVAVTDPFGLRARREAEVAKNDPALRELVPLDKDAITAFEIKPATGDAFKLTRDGEQWFVEQGGKKYRAAKERVNPLLEDVPHLRSEALATDKEEKYKELEVDEGSAIVLSVYDGGDQPKLKLSVGKSGPSYTSAFVRLDGGKEVYRAAKNIKTAVGLDFTSFRNKKPWDFEAGSVTAVEIARPPAKEDKKPEAGSAKPKTDEKAAAPLAPAIGALERFTLKDGLWKQADGRNAGQNAIKELLKALSECEVNQFVDAPDNAKTALAAATPCVKVEAGGRIYFLKLGAEENNQYYVEDQDGAVYQVSQYNLRFFFDLDYPTLKIDDSPKDEAGKDSAPNGDAASKEDKEPAEGKQAGQKSETDE